MANVNVAVLLPLDVYVKLVKREIRTSDLKMTLQPVESLEGITPVKDREVLYKEMYMPDWWADWYKTLDRAARLRFASVVQERLIKLLGGVA